MVLPLFYVSYARNMSPFERSKMASSHETTWSLQETPVPGALLNGHPLLLEMLSIHNSLPIGINVATEEELRTLGHYALVSLEVVSKLLNKCHS